MNFEIKIELPSELLATLRAAPNEFVSQMRMAAAIKWYELGKISQSKASEIAGVSRQSFLVALNDYGVSPFQETGEELLTEHTHE